MEWQYSTMQWQYSTMQWQYSTMQLQYSTMQASSQYQILGGGGVVEFQGPVAFHTGIFYVED
jgi:hypothetical protein